MGGGRSGGVGLFSFHFPFVPLFFLLVEIERVIFRDRITYWHDTYES